MIVITGGAGFIGSNLHAALVASGHETVIVDSLGCGTPGKWRNLRRHPPCHIVAPSALERFLTTTGRPEMIFHLGAISSTTAVDGDAVWESNVGLSRRIWDYCAERGVRLVYASSASTYGDGGQGFDDDPDRLGRLAPLNLYGWSKHAFDLQVMRALRSGARRPPQWVGLKFFNVYGPNEYHKGPMISVVKALHDQVAAARRPALFRSARADVADGGQKRDFIWVGDVVDVLLFLLATPGISGLFNLGTGTARSYRDLARAVCLAAGVADEVDYVDMPDHLRAQYQYFTEAPMARLRDAGYAGQFTPLEQGVTRYVRDYLAGPEAYV